MLGGLQILQQKAKAELSTNLDTFGLGFLALLGHLQDGTKFALPGYRKAIVRRGG